MAIAVRWVARCGLNGASGRSRTCGLPIRNRLLYLLSYGSVRGCPWQELQLQRATFEAVVSAVGLHGRNEKWCRALDLNQDHPQSECGASARLG